MRHIILFLRNYHPYIIYGFIMLLILGPLLAPGFILTLDMVFTPRVPLPDTVSASYPFYASLHVLSSVIPADALQKVVLGVSLFGAGLGIHRLIEYFAPNHHWSWQLAVYVAGIFYMINPFTFTRFMVGHFALLLGMAVLPWLWRASMQFFAAPSVRGAITLSLLMVVTTIVSIHSLVLAAVIIVGVASIALWRRRGVRAYGKQLLKCAALGFAVFLLLMSYWLVPTLLQSGYIAESLQHFSAADRAVFATSAEPLIGIVGTVLALYGFWADHRSLYVLPKDEYEWWLLPIIGLWVLVIAGAIILWRYHRNIAVPVTYVATIGFMGALGFHGHWFAPFASWLVENAPYIGGMREPQKFAGLLLISYAICLAFAVQYLLEKWNHIVARVAVIVGSLAIILSMTPGMLWGFDGQLKTTAYPQSWSQINTGLNRDDSQFKVLFLPWHHYMNYNFVGRTIAAPADKFFDKPVIVSDVPELGGLQPQVYNTDAAFVAQLLKRPLSKDVAEQLASRNVKYILLAKEADYKRYTALLRQPNLKLVSDTAELQLFENLAWKNL